MEPLKAIKRVKGTKVKWSVQGCPCYMGLNKLFNELAREIYNWTHTPQQISKQQTNSDFRLVQMGTGDK